MNPSAAARFAIATAKTLTWIAAGLGALAASITLAFLVMLLCMPPMANTAGALFFLATVLAALWGWMSVLKRLNWPARAALAALLLTGSVLMVPRPMCAAEATTPVSC